MIRELDEESRRALLALARESIASAFAGREARRPPQNPGLLQEAGAFVTLSEGGRLRGCIGRMGASGPILDTVMEMARAAAFEDPRFPPLRAEELEGVEIEITLLSPLRPIASIEEIEVGRHGLYISKAWHSGVLLPQVATEYGWDRETFLEQVCYKAGLPGEAWKSPGASILVFEGLVFNEGDFKRPRRS